MSSKIYAKFTNATLTSRNIYTSTSSKWWGWRDSNPHFTRLKLVASTNWTTTPWWEGWDSNPQLLVSKTNDSTSWPTFPW